MLDLLKEMLDCFIEELASDVKTFTQVFYVLENMLALDTTDQNRVLLKHIADNSSILESAHALITHNP